jgi:hypothetical protein
VTPCYPCFVIERHSRVRGQDLSWSSLSHRSIGLTLAELPPVEKRNTLLKYSRQHLSKDF